MLRRSWTEIDLAVLRNNYLILRDRYSQDREIMAVVKADAYGHGAVQTARVFEEEGCRHFAVSNLLEGIELREAGISGMILVLGYTPPEEAERLKAYGLTQTLLSESYAEKLSGKGIEAQWAIDTGMNRIGLDGDDAESCERIIRKTRDGFHLTGLFTHLAQADVPEGDAFTALQIEKFRRVCSRVGDLELPYIHCMNSACGLFHEGFGDLIRYGIVLYGLKPDEKNVLPEGIKPALTWKSVITMVKELTPGETVSYGRTFRAEKPMRIATVTTGYADGYSRFLSNTGYVLIAGKKARITGRVCMDQFMVDVTDIPEAGEESEVILIGEGLSADQMAKMCGTIGYEVVCDIQKRVERVFIS